MTSPRSRVFAITLAAAILFVLADLFFPRLDWMITGVAVVLIAVLFNQPCRLVDPARPQTVLAAPHYLLIAMPLFFIVCMALIAAVPMNIKEWYGHCVYYACWLASWFVDRPHFTNSWQITATLAVIPTLLITLALCTNNVVRRLRYDPTPPYPLVPLPLGVEPDRASDEALAAAGYTPASIEAMDYCRLPSDRWVKWRRTT